MKRVREFVSEMWLLAVLVWSEFPRTMGFITGALLACIVMYVLMLVVFRQLLLGLTLPLHSP